MAVSLVTGRPLHETLRDRRLSLGLSQSEAADLVGASEKSWRRWEKGQPIDERFHPAIGERFGIAVQPPAGLASAFDELEETLSEIRGALEQATNVHADLILRRADGATVLLDIKAFRGADDLENEIIGLVTAAAHDAGWTVHVAT